MFVCSLLFALPFHSHSVSTCHHREIESEREREKKRCAMKLWKLDPLGPSPASLDSLTRSLCLMDVLCRPSHPWCLTINMSRRQRQKEHCFTGASNLSPHSFSPCSPPCAFSLWLTSILFHGKWQIELRRIEWSHSVSLSSSSFYGCWRMMSSWYSFPLIKMHGRIPHDCIRLHCCPSSLVPSTETLLTTHACLCHSSETRLVKRPLGTSTPCELSAFHASEILSADA